MSKHVEHTMRYIALVLTTAMVFADSLRIFQSKLYSIIASENCIRNPLFPPDFYTEKGDKQLSYQSGMRRKQPTGLVQHFSYQKGF